MPSGSEAATSYQMLWKSKHGGAYLQVEKISWGLTTGRGLGGKGYKQQQGKKGTGMGKCEQRFLELVGSARACPLAGHSHRLGSERKAIAATIII